MAFMRWLQKIWHAVSEPFVLLKPIRFVVIPLAILLWALIYSAEGQDSIRAVVEFDRKCPQWGTLAWFVACVSLLALQSWYWSRQMLRVNFPQCGVDVGAATAEADAPRAKTTEELAIDYSVTQTWTPRLLGIVAFLIAIGALLRTAYLDYSGGWDYTMTVIAITIAILIVAMILFIVFVVKRRSRVGQSPRVSSHDQLAPATRYILRFTLLVALLFVIWTALSPLTAGIFLPSPSMLMISAALWIGIGSWLIYWADLYRVPIIAILLLLAFGFSFFNDNHAVRKLGGSAGPDNPIARKDIATNFNEWLGKLNAKYPSEGNHPVYIVATEGGGIRAAYWTASVLTALQDAAPQFSDHVFAISAVSGGSLGATTFTSLVADSNRVKAESDCDILNKPDSQKTFRFAAQQALSYDFLAPTLASLLHADLVQRFLPVGFIPDRAKALETGWERGWRTHIRTASGADDDFFSGGFAKMYADHGNALLPSLFLNGTIVEQGQRTITSNCLIDGDIPDSYDTLSQLGSDVRLSTAAHNSARFTYVSPVGSLLNPGLIDHIADGGYFENSGGQTAADVIRKVSSLPHPNVTFKLILIRFQEVDTTGKPVPPKGPTRFANEVLSPLRALLNVRGAHATLAYSEVQRQVNELVPPGEQFEFLLTQEQKGIVLPLGWLLAQRTRSAIDEQVGPDLPNLSPAIQPFVVRNRGFLLKIAADLAPQGALPAAKHDSVQTEAIQSEDRMKQ
jgi:hypothetical protein